MTLTVLSVAFWLTVVGPGSVGGAEQILRQIDAGLVRRGHRSLVVARPESEVAGTLIPIQSPDGRVATQSWFAAHDAIRRAIASALARYPVDVVHLHDIHFGDYLPQQDVPALVTLHMPLTWYKPQSLRISRPNTYFHCVSRSQREISPVNLPLLPDIENGIASELLQDAPHIRKQNFVAMLGRICPEKGFDVGLRAARRARIAALLAGQVFPFPEHERYFAEQIQPQLDPCRRYIGSVGSRSRRRLLASAQCVVVPSLVPETSSLVAHEAIASGTPVVAFAKGALPEVVQHGKTGLLVDHESDLPDAILAARSLNPQDCKIAAQRFYTSDDMVERYIETYHQVLERSHRKLQTAS